MWSIIRIPTVLQDVATNVYLFPWKVSNKEEVWGKDAYADEGKANQLLIQFFSSLMDISYLNLSLGIEDDGFALRIEGMDYEEVYLRIKNYVPWFSVCWRACYWYSFSIVAINLCGRSKQGEISRKNRVCLLFWIFFSSLFVVWSCNVSRHREINTDSS